MKRWNRCNNCENARVPRCCENQISDEALGFLAAELFNEANRNARNNFCGVNGEDFVSGNDNPSNTMGACCNRCNGECGSHSRCCHRCCHRCCRND